MKIRRGDGRRRKEKGRVVGNEIREGPGMAPARLCR